MGKVAAALLGVATVMPIIYLAYFFYWATTSFMSGEVSIARDSDDFHRFFALHIGTMVLIFCLLAFYVRYLFRTDRVPKDKRALWAAVLFLGNMISMPVFWYLYVWKDAQARPIG